MNTLTNTPDFWPSDFPIPSVGRMSEEEFVEWAIDQEFRTEWVDGEVIFMSPANAEHSEIRGWLYTLLRLYVSKHQLGRMLDDVMIRLSKQHRVRVPDLFFVQQSRLDIIGPTSLCEPPDLAVEIISPRSSARDWREKFSEYEAFGIAEYWIIDPNNQSCDVYRLDTDGKYQHLPAIDGVIRSSVISGFRVRSEWFDAESRRTDLEALKLLGAV